MQLRHALRLLANDDIDEGGDGSEEAARFAFLANALVFVADLVDTIDVEAATGDALYVQLAACAAAQVDRFSAHALQPAALANESMRRVILRLYDLETSAGARLRRHALTQLPQLRELLNFFATPTACENTASDDDDDYATPSQTIDATGAASSSPAIGEAAQLAIDFAVLSLLHACATRSSDEFKATPDATTLVHSFWCSGTIRQRYTCRTAPPTTNKPPQPSACVPGIEHFVVPELCVRVLIEVVRCEQAAPPLAKRALIERIRIESTFFTIVATLFVTSM